MVWGRHEAWSSRLRLAPGDTLVRSPGHVPTALEPDGSPFPVTYSAAELSSLVATRSHRSATSSPAATGTVAGSVS